MQSNNATQDRRLTEKEVLERYQISHTTLWRWVRDGKFPKGEFIGPNTKRWKPSVLIDWEKEPNKKNEEVA